MQGGLVDPFQQHPHKEDQVGQANAQQAQAHPFGSGQQEVFGLRPPAVPAEGAVIPAGTPHLHGVLAQGKAHLDVLAVVAFLN